MEIIITGIAALIIRAITSMVKPTKTDTLSPEELLLRRKAIRAFVAICSAIAMVLSAIFAGDQLDLAQLQTYVELAISTAVTYYTANGLYLYGKAKKNDPVLVEDEPMLE